MSNNDRAIAKSGFLAPSRSGDTTAAGLTQPIRRVDRRRILHTFLIETLGYTYDDALDEAKNLDRSVSDAMVERFDNHPREPTRHSDPVPSALGRPVGRVVTQLTDAESGREWAVIRVSGDEPAVLAYLAGIGLTAEARLTVRKKRSYSDVTTIQILGHAQEIHLGTVASDAVWVSSATR
ncbi:iron dependent repressor, metal binding and dimerization domain protein [Cryobacterium fucosi]|uniref:Metal-dependent transcriptional regulator n=1 Tax=Cryobacterium fucosi TaxID=1259157 RepID=A0A4R9BGK7_9MICO|nr:iron dependent repressor, metal binding and dimerization domain protein [Cryobacterium fucosi]TFD82498.1 metal-dependent transcriptional regulator [Cryobacterium fucosi]